MAGIFKSLDQSDIRITPFYAYKQWTDQAISYADYSSTLQNIAWPYGIAATDTAVIIAQNNTIQILDQMDSGLQSIYTTPAVQFFNASASISPGPFNRNRIKILNNRAVIMESTGFELFDLSNYTSTGLTIGSHKDIRDVDIDTVTGPATYLIASNYTGPGGGGMGVQLIDLLNPILPPPLINIQATDMLVSAARRVQTSDNYYYVLRRFVNLVQLYQLDLSLNIATITSIPAQGYEFKALKHNFVQDIYYCLVGGALSVVKDLSSTPVAVQLFTNVAGVEFDQAWNVYIIMRNGTIYSNAIFNSITNTLTYDTYEGNNYAGFNTLTHTTINSQGVLGIYGGNTFFRFDTKTKTFSGPAHIDGRTFTNLYSENIVQMYAVGNNSLVNLNISPANYKEYKGDYSLVSSKKSNDPLNITFDQGNPIYDGQEPYTADEKYQRVVHKSIDHLFYKDYIFNNQVSYEGGDFAFARRSLNDVVKTLSITQNNFGERIAPGSVKLVVYNSVAGKKHLIDDIYGNLYFSESIAGTQVSSSKVVGKWHFSKGYKYANSVTHTFEDPYSEGVWPMKTTYTNVGFANYTPPGTNYLNIGAYFTASYTSSVVISPGPHFKYRESFNFENSDFSIFFTIRPEYPSVNYELAHILAKESPVEDLFVDINGNLGGIPIGTNYPYKIGLYASGSNKGKISFMRSSGFQTAEVTGSQVLTEGVVYNVAVVRENAVMKIYIDGFLRGSALDTTTTGPYQIKECSNLSNIHIGLDYYQKRPYNGILDNIKLYKKALTTSDLLYLQNTSGIGDPYVGNVFYPQGIITVTHPMASKMDIIQATCRGRQTIYETEVSCTFGGGEFNHSTNPSLQEYDPVTDQFLFRPFVTGSDFKPYITTIGLYDDRGNLLVVGKLGQPIKTPNNTDTTIIVRFDR